MTDILDLADTLRQYGQEHLLEGIDDLNDAQRADYCAQLATVDWQELDHPAEHVSPDVQPSTVLTLTQRQDDEARLRDLGESAYANGQAAVLMVAGGQGTRLGFSGPKGCYELAAHSGKSIYQWQAEKSRLCQSASGTPCAIFSHDESLH